jgi:hypothetical protein
MLVHERLQPPLQIVCFLAEFEIHAIHLYITRRRTQLFNLLNRLTVQIFSWPLAQPDDIAFLDSVGAPRLYTTFVF